MKLFEFTQITKWITSEYLMHKTCNMSRFVSYFNYTLYFLEVSCHNTSTFMTSGLIHRSNWTGKIWTSDFPKKLQRARW